MPQKKRTTKRKSSTRRKSKRNKVYIPANSVISLCAIVVGVCTALLLGSSIFSKKDEAPVQKPAVVSSSKVERERKSASPAASSSSKSASKKQTASSEKNRVRPSDKTPVPLTKTEPVKETKQTALNPSASQSAAASSKEQTVSKTVEVSSNSSSSSSEKKETKKWDIPDFPQAVNGAKIVMLFDDGGQNLQQLEKCVTLPFPVTVAVLPGLVHSKEAADRVRSSGNEVMLHQPMQSINLNVNPGPGAITPDMTEEQIASQVFQNLYSIGPVAGMNNHEGSLITADAEKIATVMKVCSEQGVFFLDSRTNKDTQVPYVANTLGYGYYERNGQFLDNTKVRADILSMIEKNVQTANRQGAVIMIGHVWSADVLPGILREVYPLLSAKGYTFTTVSKSGALKR